MPPIEFLVDRRDAGQTVSAVLRKRFDLPWSHIKRVIENGHVRVAGFACKDPGHRVKAKNRVWIREGVLDIPPENRPVKSADSPPAKKPSTSKPSPPPAKQKPAAPRPLPPMPVSPADLVYVDDAIVVVNKPAGLTTMRHEEELAEFGARARRFLPLTLADFVPRLLGAPNSRVIPVHRLDHDTTGLIVFARTPDAADDLMRQFRKHTTDRRYLALTRGIPTDGRIESTLVRDRGDGRRGSTKESASPGGKRAVTHVKVLEKFEGIALVECRLETGRTHQVRIHLGEAGTPLCGETVYDRPVDGKRVPDGSGAARPMLHATRLGIAHPETAEPLQWEVPPPADFATLLEKLRNAGQ